MSYPRELFSSYTSARVGLGRCGTGLPTSDVLDFRMAHAQARDAVHVPADLDGVAKGIAKLGLSPVLISSQAHDRATYVARPDLGRKLDGASVDLLKSHAESQQGSMADLAVVVCDGLSGAAVDSWAVELLRQFVLLALPKRWSFAPVAVVRNGRVAIGDPIGEHLGARMTILLIGERPGLGSADSLGVYLTHAPRTGTTDEARNCISNIRADGLPPIVAAQKMAWLVAEALRRGLTGTALKEEAPCSLEQLVP